MKVEYITDFQGTGQMCLLIVGETEFEQRWLYINFMDAIVIREENSNQSIDLRITNKVGKEK